MSSKNTSNSTTKKQTTPSSRKVFCKICNKKTNNFNEFKDKEVHYKTLRVKVMCDQCGELKQIVTYKKFLK